MTSRRAKARARSAVVAAPRARLSAVARGGLRRLAILGNVGYPASVIEMNDVQAAARTLGLEVITLEIRRAEDVAPAFITLKDRAGAQGRATGRPPDSGTNQVQLRDQPQDRQGHLVGDREQSDWDVKTESVRS